MTVTHNRRALFTGLQHNSQLFENIKYMVTNG